MKYFCFHILTWKNEYGSWVGFLSQKCIWVPGIRIKIRIRAIVTIVKTIVTIVKSIVNQWLNELNDEHSFTVILEKKNFCLFYLNIFYLWIWTTFSWYQLLKFLSWSLRRRNLLENDASVPQKKTTTQLWTPFYGTKDPTERIESIRKRDIT